MVLRAGKPMRVAVLGGTGFIGRAVVSELTRHGHDVTVMHRGEQEARSKTEARRMLLDKRNVNALRRACLSGRIDVLVHVCAYDTADAEAVANALPRECRLIVLSSVDVYRAFHSVMNDDRGYDSVPLTENAPLRSPNQRYMYRGRRLGGAANPSTYEKLDVEAVCAKRGSVILRLSMVYGEHDPQFREGVVLRRVCAGRTKIPIGSGAWLWSRVWVHDVASAVRCVVQCGIDRGVYNIAERSTWTVAEWLRRIAVAADREVDWVRVPDELLPEDLEFTAAPTQHLLFDSSQARRELEWQPTDPEVALRASVEWHLRNSMHKGSEFADDDLALAAASR